MNILKNTTDGSGRVISISFTDEEGNSIIPNSASWSLINKEGETINNRTNISLTPAEVIYISLLPEDNLYTDGSTRILFVKGEYTSTLTNGNITVRAGAVWRISDLPE